MSTWMDLLHEDLKAWAMELTAQAYSDSTVRQRVGIVRFIANAAGVPPRQLTKAHLLAYLAAGDYKPRTIDGYLESVRLFCAWACMENITSSVKPRRAPRPASSAERIHLKSMTDSTLWKKYLHQDLRDWAEHLAAEAFAERTIRHRVDTLRFITRSAGVAPRELTRSHLVDYLVQGNYAPRTRENYLVCVRLFCAWANMGDITAQVRRPRIPHAVPKPVSEDTLNFMLEEASLYPRTFAWIVLGAYAGLRSCESASLRASDLQRSSEGWVLRVIGKGQVERVIPVPPLVVDVLQRWIEDAGGRGPLWPGATSRSVQNAIRRVAEQVGVTCSSHQLRHRYGTAAYRLSRDLLLVQRLMGHSSPKFTAGYAQVDMHEANDTVLRLPGAAAAAALMTARAR